MTPHNPRETELPASSALSGLDFPVVGIGASAGGIQALLRFFEHMPDDAGMAFIIILHLSPTHESHADEILQRVTKMPITQVLSSIKLEKNHVYLISPATALSLADDFLHVTPDERLRGRPITIDVFFRSLADAHGTRAISIVLSGFGSDGAIGISRIKEQGGIAIAQSPADAEYQDMPNNAIATGFVDLVLPVAEMPRKLIDLRDNARLIRLLPSGDGPLLSSLPAEEHAGSSVEQALQQVLTILRNHSGHDFRHYKRATVLRRVERRLQVNGVSDLPGYWRFLEAHPEEATALLKDMLIGVTNFFRDREAFDAVERDVIPRIFSGKSQDEQVRAWVAGCSTGEEAYSLAMLMCEALQDGQAQPAIQVFATDIDDRAVGIARSGAYPESIVSEFTPQRLHRFFTVTASRFVVAKSLRDKVLFAPHNVLRDPPFSRVDLVSCRNLLIYLDRSVQRQVLQTFHFALRPGGYLFLGSSESAEIADDLFTPVDKKNRIYKAKVLASRLKSQRAMPVTNPIISSSHFAPSRPAVGPMVFSSAMLHQRALEYYAPPSVIVDRDGEILHMSERVGRFFRYIGGEPSRNLLKLINPDLRLELRTALSQALQSGKSVDARRARFTRGDAYSYVNMTVRPFKDDAIGSNVVLIFFDELIDDKKIEALDPAETEHSPMILQLESELHSTKEQLQTTVEQANFSTEELKASNEELQAINEELRSATEELETSKEELQSVNEELITVNAELQAKVEETAKANDDLQNLIVSTGIATIFVDRQMRIKRYTAPAVGLFNLIATDIGRPLLDLTHRLDYPELAGDARASFETLRLTEREVKTHDGEWYLARLLPYRTSDDRIDGAVLTLIDITSQRQAQAAARTSEDRLKLAALSTDDYAIIVQDLDGVIVSWNKGAQRVFGYDEAEMLGKPIDLIFLKEDLANGAPLAERVRATSVGRAEDERWYVRRDGRAIYCSGVLTPIDADNFKGYAKIARDFTDKKGAENQQHLQLTLERAVRTQAEEANRLKDEFFAVLSHELKNPLNLIHVKAELLTRVPEARDIVSVQEAADAIRRSVVSQAKIIDDLLDLSRIRTGKLMLDIGPVDLELVARSVVEASSADALAKGVALSLAGPDTPVMVEADAVRVEQMLWNLMRNALKFTPEGGEVKVILSRKNGFAGIEVVDTGRGIAADFLPKIFDMFSQADGGGRRDSGGLGIGLSLVKQLIEMHGGRIEAASAGLGHGARFCLWLPEKAQAPSQKIRAVAADPSILRGLRVLLVDDALESLEAFRVLLELDGAQVWAESSAEGALTALAEHEFDLILSDIGMPAMNGLEFIERLRQSPRTAHVPALALTGFGREQDAVQALRAGYHAHLSKPVSLHNLLEAIARVLSNTRST
jgi:two-component system CheB/CheR fusion protein